MISIVCDRSFSEVRIRPFFPNLYALGHFPKYAFYTFPFLNKYALSIPPTVCMIANDYSVKDFLPYTIPALYQPCS